ncbi:MAG: thiamine pyrophosphate-dependent dehydrogenase E1 component subunit alpha [Ardenticatenaceae bacterium]|nr:thiamine pyrophosphate-dependent dehydrogenase E1 component subunit alpha [Ardenticatenaceae bacterium]
MVSTDDRGSAIRRLDLRGSPVREEDLLHAMQTIRAVETALAETYLEGAFEGPLHVSIGQEGAAVGVVAAMGADDVLVSNHRGHGHALAFGLDPRRVIAEIVGDPCGYAGGRGGSMHIFAPDDGFLGTNGIVGDSAALGVGAALAIQQSAGGQVAVVIIGDGAMGTGVVYESLNLASLWHLPLVFVCENNQYAEMTPTSIHLSSPPYQRAKSFGLAAIQLPGDDVRAVVEGVQAAVRDAREGKPAFVEVLTYRWGGHYVGDPARYRPEGEEESWRNQHCPIRFLARRLGREAQLEDLQARLQAAARAVVAEVLAHNHHLPEGSQAQANARGESGR